jgi:hypothetical protein
VAFRSVFVDGKISNPATGNVIHLHLMDEGNTLPYLESVSINLERGANLELSMNLAPPYDKALEMISKDNEWLRLGNTLGLRWGYADVPGAISDWYYGFMQMPEVSFGDEISITVPATTLAWNADRVERVRGWASEESPRSFRSVAEEIAQRYGLVAEFGELNPSVQLLVDEPQVSLIQGGRTDLQFIMEEGEKYGMRMISLNDKLYFVDAEAPLPGFPDVNATFQMYGKIDIWNNIFPMTSFSPESMGTLFIKQFQGTNALAYGPNDDPTVEKEPSVSTDKAAPGPSFTSKETVANPPEADGKPPSDMGDVKTKATVKVDPNAGEGGRIMCLPLNGQETSGFIESFLNGAREGTAEEHGLSVSFGCFAVPNLLPGMFVRLAGIGDYFSGTYMLQKLGLTIDSGGAEMDCEAFGRGFPAIDRQLDPFAAEVESYTDPAQNEWFDSLFTEVKEPSE